MSIGNNSPFFILQIQKTGFRHKIIFFYTIYCMEFFLISMVYINEYLGRTECR
jgi:hypothetical protein